MPIHCPIPIESITDEVFQRIDEDVMRCAYASQNELGRLCDERVYENDIADRLRAQGLNDVHTQVPVTVTHRGFVKVYRLDLVVHGMVYELKTVSALIAEHAAQAIHYAVMLGTNKVKLLNFRSTAVEGSLKASPIRRADSQQITLNPDRYSPLGDRCDEALRYAQGFIADIGAFLEARLYREALVHHFGGESRCQRRVAIKRGNLELGTHRFNFHSDGVAFLFTAFTDAVPAYEQQLRRLLRLTAMKGIQWMNLANRRLDAVTLT